MKRYSIIVFLIIMMSGVNIAHADNFYIPENSCLRRVADNVLMSINRGTVAVTCGGNQFFVQVKGMSGACRMGAVIAPNGDMAPVSLCFQRRNRGTQRFVPQQKVYSNHGYQQRYSRQNYRNLERYNNGNGSYRIMNMPDNDFREYAVREDWRTDHHTPQLLNNYDQALRISTEYGLGRTQEQLLRSSSDVIDRALYRLVDKLCE